MKRIGLAFVVATAVGAGIVLTAPVQAAGLSGQLGTVASELSEVQQAQYYYGGRRYCWYPDGWHGPGWYWCGYGARVGYGWGGPVGWRGWHWYGGGHYWHGGHRHGGGHWHHH